MRDRIRNIILVIVAIGYVAIAVLTLSFVFVLVPKGAMNLLYGILVAILGITIMTLMQNNIFALHSAPDDNNDDDDGGSLIPELDLDPDSFFIRESKHPKHIEN